MTEENTPTGEFNQAEPQEPQAVANDGMKDEPKKDEPVIPPEIQEKIDKRVNRLVFEKYEAKRKAEELEKKLSELNSKTAEQPKEVPPLPDYVTEEERKLLESRDKALIESARNKAYSEFEAKRLLEEKQKKVTESYSKMKKNAVSLGINREELENAENIVGAILKGKEEIVHYIINHEKAPLIVKHLAGSIEELSSISSMPPVQAAAYIASSVVPKTERFTPKTPGAPPPIDASHGKGPGKPVDPYLEGVSWE